MSSSLAALCLFLFICSFKSARGGWREPLPKLHQPHPYQPERVWASQERTWRVSPFLPNLLPGGRNLPGDYTEGERRGQIFFDVIRTQSCTESHRSWQCQTLTI